MDAATAENLICAIVAWVVEHGSYATKTKLLKLLYLFDVEYYRVHRRTFTGFGWKFFHLGPWAAEFDPILERLVGTSVLMGQRSSSEYEVDFYRAAERVEWRAVFSDVKDECILMEVLKVWGARSTGEILNYVYFQTAPMEGGIRSQPLDFSLIPPEARSVYSRSLSGRTRAEIQGVRGRFQAEQAERTARRHQPFAFTPPRYDDEFFEAMAGLQTK